MERLGLWRRDKEAEFCQWYRYQDSALVTLWNITSRSSNFPCRSPQIVICFDMAVEAWFKFGNLLSCMADSFKIPATYFACRRCCYKEKNRAVWRLFNLYVTSLPSQVRSVFTSLYQDGAMSSKLHVTCPWIVVQSSSYFTSIVQCRPTVTAPYHARKISSKPSVCVCLTRMCN